MMSGRGRGRARAPATKGSGPQTTTLNYPAPQVCGPPPKTPELFRRFSDQDEERGENTQNLRGVVNGLEGLGFGKDNNLKGFLHN